MYKSESVINDLLIEVDLLSNRLTNIKHAYRNTLHYGLRKRLLCENKINYLRLKEIYSIAKELKNMNKDKLSFSYLLVEKCERSIAQSRIEKNLFFL